MTAGHCSSVLVLVELPQYDRSGNRFFRGHFTTASHSSVPSAQVLIRNRPVASSTISSLSASWTCRMMVSSPRLTHSNTATVVVSELFLLQSTSALFFDAPKPIFPNKCRRPHAHPNHVDQTLRCRAQRGAGIRPDFNWNGMPTYIGLMMCLGSAEHSLETTLLL